MEDLREELNCPICRDYYIDPASLRCGHNFCQSCITSVLDAHKGSGPYSCPECRAEYHRRPVLVRNRKLRNIVMRFQRCQPAEDTKIFCTFCKPVALAVKSCLHCDTSMCEKHLTDHNQTMDHLLAQPTATSKTTKCFVHGEFLKYYCPQDQACVCVSCCLAGAHRGHEVETLDQALSKKKEKLKNAFEQLIQEREAVTKKVKDLEEHKKKEEEKADSEKKRLAGFLEDFRGVIYRLRKRMTSKISRQEELVSQYAANMKQQLETRMDELSRKMCRIKELCDMKDSIEILQDLESNMYDDIRKVDEDMNVAATVIGEDEDLDTEEHIEGDTEPVDPDEDFESEGSVSSICSSVPDEDLDIEEFIEGNAEPAHIDEVLISLFLHRTITGLISDVKSKHGFHIEITSGLLLDVNTAGDFVGLSDDCKTAFHSKELETKAKCTKRFRGSNVMSLQSFTSGKHFWEVELGEEGYWDAGVCYPSINRRREGSALGNDDSWYFSVNEVDYFAAHKKKCWYFPFDPPITRLGVYLDYEAGRLSFYKMCDPIKPLHTFTTTFTQPLHAIFYICDNSFVKIIG